MDKGEKIREAKWIALRRFSDVLSATHAKPFTESFFDEHRSVIERVIRRLFDEVQADSTGHLKKTLL